MKRYTHYRHPSKILINKWVFFWVMALGLVLAAKVWAHGGSSSPKLGESHEHNSGEGISRLSLGETVYKHMCTFCHGADGNGAQWFCDVPPGFSA